MRNVSYADRSDEAQQEQLDWLHQIHEEEQRQTALLARIARHTSLFYGLAIIWTVLAGIWLLGQLFDLLH